MEHDFQGWITLWKWMLIVCMALFGIMAVAVSIGGFFDIKKLLKTLAAQHQEAEEQEKTPE